MGLTSAAVVGCAGPPPPCAVPSCPSAPCAKGKICVSAARGLMGSGDSVCALGESRRFLEVKLVADCSTSAPLTLNIRTADPYDSDFKLVHEEHPDTLTANQVKELQTTTPLELTPRVKQLRLEVRAKCDDGDNVAMRSGDARCDVPPASGTR